MATNPTTIWTPAGGYLDPKNYVQGGTVNYLDASGNPATSPLNPNQFATSATASGIAGNLGGTVVNQQLEGPGLSYSTPQAQISVPGAPSLLNAGLVANTYGNYGTSPTGYGQYEVNRDITGNTQNYNQWALSQPGFQMDPKMANSGPGYNFVPDGKGGYINQAAPGSAPMSQAQAISFMQKAANPTPTTTAPRQSAATIGSGYNPYTSQATTPTTTAPRTTTPTQTGGNLTRTPYQQPYTTNSLTRTSAPAVTDPYQQMLIDNGMASNSLSRGGYTGAPTSDGGGLNVPNAGTDGGGQAPYGGYFNYNPGNEGGIDFGNTADTPTQNMSFQGSDGTWYTWNGGSWDQSPDPPPGYTQNADGSWSAPTPGTGEPPNEGQPPPPPTTGGGAPPPPTTGGGGGGTTRTGGIPGPGFAPSGVGSYAPGGGPNAPNYGLGYTPYIGAGAGGSAINPYASNPYAITGNNLPNGDPIRFMSTNGEDINKRIESDRNMALTEGEGLQGDLRNYTNVQQERAGGYENSANRAYEGIAAGYGGYSDAEKAAIQNNDYLNSLQLSDQQMQDNYLTQDEQGTLAWAQDADGNWYQTGTPGIRGDPYRAYRQLGTDESSMDTAMNSWRDQVGGAIGEGDTGINNALNTTGSNVREAVYGQRDVMRNDLNDIAGLTRQYVDPSKLGLSDEYKDTYQVTPRDMQNIRDKAGRSVGAQEAMDEQNLELKANAQGNTSPLAIQAARNRMRQTGAVNEANAMSNADIAAKQLQLNTEQTREGTRLGAEQNYANLGTSNEQYMGNSTLGTESTLGAAQIGAEQYLGSQQQQARQFQSSQKVAAQQTLGAAAQGAEQWKTGTNLAAGQTAEQAEQARNQYLATNRQATNQSNQNQQFTRGQYIYGNTAANNTNFANQRLTAEQEYRNYLATQGQQAQQNVTIGNQQRTGAYQGQMGAQNASSGTGVQNYAVKGFGERIFDATIPILYGGGQKKPPGAALGTVSKGPTKALVGEAGPELIVDLKRGGDGMYGIGDDDDDEQAEPMMYGDEVSGYDDSSMDDSTTDDNSGVGGEPLYRDDLKPKKMKGSQVAGANPLWKRIATGVRDAYLPPVMNPSTYQQPGTNAGAGNIVSDLVTNYLRKRTPDDPGYQSPDQGDYGNATDESYFDSAYAFGGVSGPGSFAGKNTGHHPYGKKGLPKGLVHAKTPRIKTFHIPGMPKIGLVTKPHIMKLGAKVPQAVIPLTRRAGNKVNVEDIPELMSKYGV